MLALITSSKCMRFSSLKLLCLLNMEIKLWHVNRSGKAMRWVVNYNLAFAFNSWLRKTTCSLNIVIEGLSLPEWIDWRTMNCMGKINMRKSRIVHTIVTIHIKQILLKYLFAFCKKWGLVALILIFQNFDS